MPILTPLGSNFAKLTKKEQVKLLILVEKTLQDSKKAIASMEEMGKFISSLGGPAPEESELAVQRAAIATLKELYEAILNQF